LLLVGAKEGCDGLHVVATTYTMLCAEGEM
jgi:hypothetical protein